MPSNSDDQGHIEFLLSVKAPLLWWGARNRYVDGNQHKVYFGYTGKYDFYVNTRPSSPIVSRLQNPGFFYKYDINDSNIEHKDRRYKNSLFGNRVRMSLDNFSIGVFHESNGQDVGSSDFFLAKRDSIQLGLDRNGSSGNANIIARDFISRSWNYFGLVLKTQVIHPFIFTKGDVKANVYFRARSYFSSEDENYDWLDPDGVRIDPEDEQIADYNSLNIIYETSLADHTRFSLSATSGKELNNISYKAQLSTHKIFNVPLTIFYFDGYADNVSSYYIRNKYVGAGIELW